MWGTDDDIMDVCYEHLQKKYKTIKRTDGEGKLFLAILEQKFVEGSLFTKPENLQAIFDNVLPNGPTWTSKRLIENPTPMSQDYIKELELPSEKADTSLGKFWLGLFQQQIPVRPDGVYSISKLGSRFGNNGFNERDKAAMVHLANFFYYTRNKSYF